MRRREAQKNIYAKKVSSLAPFVAGLLISIALLSPISFSIKPSQESAAIVAISLQSALAQEDDDEVAPVDESREISSNPFYEGFCSLNSPSTWFQGCIAAGFYEIIYTPSALLLAGGGWLFDVMLAFSLSSTVLDADFARNGWAITRDLANMLFIFILLAIAIATILQISSYGAKSLLARLVIVALLLNFSLFITRVVVDVSNVTARLFYDSISSANTTANVASGANALTASSYLKAGFDVPPKDISAGLVGAFNPQQLLGIESFSTWVKSGKGLGELFFIYLFATTLNIMTAWIFVSIALLFITRVAVIWFLMAVAPLAFIATILPNTKSLASKWWGELFSKSFSIAVFLFFLWIIAALTSSSFLKNTFNTSVSADGGLLQFVVIVGLQFGVLIVMLMMAKKVTMSMAGSIGGVSLNIGNKLAGGALGLLAGGVGGRLARGVIGRGGAMMAGSEGLRNAEQKGGATGWAARRMLLAGDAVSKKSFDIRNVPAVQKAMGSIDAGLGKGGGKGGYEAILKAQVKKKEGIGKFLGGARETRDESAQTQAAQGRLGAATLALSEAKARETAARSEKEIASARNLVALAESRVKEEQETINSIKKGVDQRSLDRKTGYINRLQTKGDSVLSTLKRSVGRAPAQKDRQAALALRKGKKTVKQLVDEALETSGETKKEKPKEEEGGQKGSGEIKNRFTT
ncbi:MAG: hypothetical protein NUV49_01320 [Patescibacteria group bacterium]|nr:hypothetical protein [Patescibacteria group bacterium]